jgi:hypothetical protein
MALIGRRCPAPVDEHPAPQRGAMSDHLCQVLKQIGPPFGMIKLLPVVGRIGPTSSMFCPDTAARCGLEADLCPETRVLAVHQPKVVFFGQTK